MKLILIIFVFILFVLSGVYVYLKYYARYKFYCDMLYLCNYLKGNINFSKLDLNTLINDSLGNMSFISKYILKEYQKGRIVLLGNTDKKSLISFFNGLGVGDVSYEIENLEYQITIFKEIVSQSKEDLKNKGVTYLKIIIAIGLIACIILI